MAIAILLFLLNVFCTRKIIAYKYEITLWTQNEAHGCLETAEMH